MVAEIGAGHMIIPRNNILVQLSRYLGLSTHMLVSDCTACHPCAVQGYRMSSSNEADSETLHPLSLSRGLPAVAHGAVPAAVGFRLPFTHCTRLHRPVIPSLCRPLYDPHCIRIRCVCLLSAALGRTVVHDASWLDFVSPIAST